MAYKITKSYLDKQEVNTNQEISFLNEKLANYEILIKEGISSLNEKLANYQGKIKRKVDGLIVRHAALVCEYEEQESKKLIKSDMAIITRQEAMAQGLKRYYTGMPCLHGHYSFRYTKTAQCNTCVNGLSNQNNDHILLKERIAIRSSFEEITVRLRLDNAQSCLNLCLDVVNKTHSIIEKSDILIRNAPFDKKAGTGLFKLRFPIELKPELIKISNHSLFGDSL